MRPGIWRKTWGPETTHVFPIGREERTNIKNAKLRRNRLSRKNKEGVQEKNRYTPELAFGKGGGIAFAFKGWGKRGRGGQVGGNLLSEIVPEGRRLSVENITCGLVGNYERAWIGHEAFNKKGRGNIASDKKKGAGDFGDEIREGKTKENFPYARKELKVEGGVSTQHLQKRRGGEHHK